MGHIKPILFGTGSEAAAEKEDFFSAQILCLPEAVVQNWVILGRV